MQSNQVGGMQIEKNVLWERALAGSSWCCVLMVIIDVWVLLHFLQGLFYPRTLLLVELALCV
jgi:membrane protein required for beta-lactamase induction